MPAVFEYPVLASAHDLDGQGHVSNVKYVEWMQAAAVAHSDAQGWPPQRYRAAGVTWVIRSHYIRYLKPARAGDELLVLTWVADFRKATSLRKYKFIRQADEEVLARAETDWAFLDATTNRPRRIPADLIESFEVVPKIE